MYNGSQSSIQDSDIPERIFMNDKLPGAFETMQIDPSQYSLQQTSSRLQSTRYAIAGLFFLLRHQASMRWLAAVTITAFSLAFILRIDTLHALLLLISVGGVWVTESINTAIEAVVNLAADGRWHAMAKVSKDVGATATFIATFVAFVVTITTLLPPLLNRIGL